MINSIKCYKTFLKTCESRQVSLVAPRPCGCPWSPDDYGECKSKHPKIVPTFLIDIKQDFEASRWKMTTHLRVSFPYKVRLLPCPLK
jgi:hypothetical protein